MLFRVSGARSGCVPTCAIITAGSLIPCSISFFGCGPAITRAGSSFAGGRCSGRYWNIIITTVISRRSSPSRQRRRAIPCGKWKHCFNRGSAVFPSSAGFPSKSLPAFLSTWLRPSLNTGSGRPFPVRKRPFCATILPRGRPKTRCRARGNGAGNCFSP